MSERELLLLLKTRTENMLAETDRMLADRKAMLEGRKRREV